MEKLKNPIETIVIRMKLRIRLSTTYHGLPAILLKYKKPRFFFVCLLHSTGSKYSCTAIGIIHAHIAVNLSDGCSRTHVPTQISFSYLEDDQYLSEQ